EVGELRAPGALQVAPYPREAMDDVGHLGGDEQLGDVLPVVAGLRVLEEGLELVDEVLEVAQQLGREVPLVERERGLRPLVDLDGERLESPVHLWVVHTDGLPISP